MGAIRPLVWVASSRNDLLSLPPPVVAELGYGLFLAQIGEPHEARRVLSGFGNACVVELLASRRSGTYRAVYSVRFAQAIFVLHVVQKKARHGIATPKQDLDLIAARLWRAAELAQELE